MSVDVEKGVVDILPIFKALSDVNRFRIFAELTMGDSCNCELRDRLGLAPSLLTHHLKLLEKVGLIASRRDVIDGRWIYYAVNRETINHLHDWVTLFFDPNRLQERPLCGPEGQCEPAGNDLASRLAEIS